MLQRDMLRATVSLLVRIAAGETGDISETQSKGNVRRWKPLASNG
jgi:hypothetical protein